MSDTGQNTDMVMGHDPIEGHAPGTVAQRLPQPGKQAFGSDADKTPWNPSYEYRTGVQHVGPPNQGVAHPGAPRIGGGPGPNGADTSRALVQNHRVAVALPQHRFVAILLCLIMLIISDPLYPSVLTPLP